MDELRFHLSALVFRLPVILVSSAVLSALAVLVAVSLPAVYVSQMRLVVATPPVPDVAAPAIASPPVLEHLQIIEQRLMTRANMLQVAEQSAVFSASQERTPDQLVAEMRARTTIDLPTARNALPMMTIGFQAPTPAQTADVLTAYLDVIRRDDAAALQNQMHAAQEILQAEGARLGAELDDLANQIATLKAAHAQALPEDLQLRHTQLVRLEDQEARLSAQIAAVRLTRDRLVAPYLGEGGIVASDAEALDRVAAALPRVLRGQFADLSAQISALAAQRLALRDEASALSATIDTTADVAGALRTLEQRRTAINAQHGATLDQLARVQAAAVAPRISVIEAPALPDAPSGPNRRLIAGGGACLAILTGLALGVLLNVFSTVLRRPEDIERHLGVRPFATVPDFRVGPKALPG